MISVVVPAYNAASTLDACLGALEAQTVDRRRYEVIVVDDGSTDATADVARSYDVQLIQQANAGPAAARNRGVQAARGELLLFTDADCAPAPDWIEQITAPFSDPDVVGAKGVYCTEQRALVARFVQLEYQRKVAPMARQERIDFIDTYSAAYRREVFLANGGFDPALRVDEDQEFSFRLARKGYRLVFVPGAVVAHQHVTTVSAYARRKLSIGCWKAPLLRWHPERALRDSHTPQVLKLQIGLVALLGLALLMSPFRSASLVVALTAAALFFGSALPFLAHIARQDPPVLLVAPCLLVVRALALGLGLIAGFVRFRGHHSDRRAPIGGLHSAAKRAVDVVGSLVGLILSAPLLAALALAVKLDSEGPVLLLQERAGQHGRPFRLLQLRTTVEGAAPLGTDAAAPAGPVDAADRPDHRRVTRVGRLLRRTGLHQLPGLWNVLKGDVSLVGPRPEPVHRLRHYDDWHRRRFAVRPGLTGVVQLHGGAHLTLDERVALELDYIRHYSLLRDLGLLARAALALLSSGGAHRNIQARPRPSSPAAGPGQPEHQWEPVFDHRSEEEGRSP